MKHKMIDNKPVAVNTSNKTKVLVSFNILLHYSPSPVQTMPTMPEQSAASLYSERGNGQCIHPHSACKSMEEASSRL